MMAQEVQDCCSNSNLPEMVPSQLQHAYLEASIPDSLVSGFVPVSNYAVKSKQSKNINNEPQKWIAQANKISTQLPNKACKLYLDAAKELAAQHNILLASQALHSLASTSSAEKLTAKAHLLLARPICYIYFLVFFDKAYLLRLFDLAHSSYHYECSFKSYFSLTPCNPPPFPPLSSISPFSSSSSVSSEPPSPATPTPPSPTSNPSTPASSVISSYPPREHPPLPPRTHLLRDTRAWATATAQEVSHGDMGAASDDDKRAEPTTNDQIKVALECVVEAGKFSQDSVFAALACDVCGVCESVGLLEKAGIKSEVNWLVKAAEKYAKAGVQSHSIDALLDAHLKEPKGDSPFLLKALSKSIMIDDRVRVQKILKLLGNNGRKDEERCLVAIGRAHADADASALDAIAGAWRGVLAACEDASDAHTCALYHLS